MVIAAELEEDENLSSKTLKIITSTNYIAAEKKFFDPMSFNPSHTIILYTNFLPNLNASDDATRRRITLLQFDQKIPSDNEVKNYTDVLYQECGGAILDWAIEGAVKFHQNKYKLIIPKDIEEFTERYFNEQDCFGNFIEECCIIDENVTSTSQGMLEAYNHYAYKNGFNTGSYKDLNDKLTKMGFISKKTNRGKLWIGIGLQHVSNI